MTRESVYESLKLFDKLFNKMNDLEKKNFINTFIERIELYPDKKPRNGFLIKQVYFKFSVAYNGESVYDFWIPKATTDEAVTLLELTN